MTATTRGDYARRVISDLERELNKTEVLIALAHEREGIISDMLNELRAAIEVLDDR